MSEKLFKPFGLFSKKSIPETENVETVRISLPIATPDGSKYSHEDILNAITATNIKGIQIFWQQRGTGVGKYKDVIVPTSVLIDGGYGYKFIHIEGLQMKIEDNIQKVVIGFEELGKVFGAKTEALRINDETFQSYLPEDHPLHQKS